MGKSNYPGKLDTSVEIPPVRENIVEIGADVINSIRSAIFQIERVLGINPQGAVGNTVSDRLNSFSDGNGNILKSALSGANVLSGPILDSDVAGSAAIREDKLRLDYPTQLLQDEISIINGQLDNMIAQLTELVGQFAVHINTNSINRHPGTAISIAASSGTPSATSTNTLASGSLQTTFETVYNGHVNYTGADITETNNSHLANQIFFDDSNLTNILSADDVQEAVEEIAIASQISQINHQDLFHSNGVLRIGKIDTSDLEGVGNVLASNLVITFTKTSGSSENTTLVSFTSPPSLGDFVLEVSDILTITDTSDVDELFVGSYEISNINIASGTDDILSVEIYGLLKSDSSASTKGMLSKNINAETNLASFLTAPREEAGLTSAKNIQICNPNSVMVTSLNIKPSEINTSNETFNISIDEGSDIEFSVFDASASRQSIDTIISIINEKCAEDRLNILAYRLDLDSGGSELVIAHNLPDEGTDKHTLRISQGSDTAIDSLGFSDIDDIIVYSEFGSEFFISGIPLGGLKKKLDSTDLAFFIGGGTVDTSSLDFNFFDYKLKVGDLLVISEAESSSDDGTFVITNITSSQLTLDTGQLPAGFIGSSTQEQTRFRVFENIVSFENLTFDEVAGSSGSQLLDVFMDSNREVFSDKRLEFTPVISGATSLLDIVDFRGDISEKQFDLLVTDSDSFVDVSLDSGPTVKIYGTETFVWVSSGDENVWLKLYIKNATSLKSKVVLDGDQTVNIYGFSGVNKDSNLLLSRVLYGSFNGRVSGSPKITSILQRGSIGPDELSTETRKQFSEVPLDELRADGVVYGLEVVNASSVGGFFAIGLTRGACYVGGKRFEIDEVTEVVTDILTSSTDKVFVIIDENGVLDFGASVSNGLITCISPFADSTNVSLATLEFSSPNVDVIDLRLFIDHLDLKLLNSITVSPTKGMGHFDSVPKALRYAKRFYELYPNSGVPSIHLKSGTHTMNVDVDESSTTRATWITNFLAGDTATIQRYNDANIADGFFVGFPVDITGEGDSTIVSVKANYTFSDFSDTYRGNIYIPGDGFTGPAGIPFDVLTDGFIALRDFKTDNTRVNFLNNSLDDGAGTDFNFGINIDNINFDFTDFKANSLDSQLDLLYGTSGVFFSNGTGVIGNFKIRGCSFNECLIGMVDPGNIRNLEVSGNTVYGNVALLTEGALFGADIFHVTADYDLIPNQFSAAENNITIFGNINATNLTVNNVVGGPKIHRLALPAVTGTGGWGDRFSRDVVVGNNMSVNGNYLYDRVYDSGGGLAAGGKTKSRFYTAEYLDAANMPLRNVGSGYKTWQPGAPFPSLPGSLAPAGTVGAYSKYVINGGTTMGYFEWPERTIGEVITSVTLGVLEDTSSFNWIFYIYSHNRNTAISSVYVSGLEPNVYIINEIGEVTFTFNTSVAVSSQPYFFAIAHDDSGADHSFVWLEVTTKVLSVENAVGIID